MDKINQHFPGKARELLVSNGKELIAQIGLDIVRNIVLDVLCGKNLRDSTELLTRKRIATLNAAALVMMLRGSKKDKDFIEKLPDISASELKKRLQKADRWILEWNLGLTDKAYQNVLRDNPKNLDDYKSKFVGILREVVSESKKEYGNLAGQIKLGGDLIDIDWDTILQIMTSIGAQTLAIRGSEKSTYGKLYERLILGALLEILGFKLVEKNNISNPKKVFWLSSREEKRESDATLLFEAGKGVRFDIGFIGRGNPEISLDKVSRFEREITLGKTKWFMATIIVVDRIGQNSRIEALAKRIGGDIVQMSGAYWPFRVAGILRARTGYKSDLLRLKDKAFFNHLKKKISKIDFQKIINYPSVQPTRP
ncbi:MAG: CfrBI family restriction endonuclease [Candidatus Liptonbacteria bacterium]|nr:CfrBI family restriction endonuclease [Candidatus Liptonbacteria bacterium]